MGAPRTLSARTRARRLARSLFSGRGRQVWSRRGCAPHGSRAGGSGSPQAAAQDEAGSLSALGVLLPLRVGAGHRLPLPLPGRSPAAARLPRAGRRLPGQRLRGPPVSSEAGGAWGHGPQEAGSSGRWSTGGWGLRGVGGGDKDSGAWGRGAAVPGG